ncbi:MAG: HIT domain-containing protein [Rhizobiaceae bacterium]|nr:HIT domain-containing protein [Rhizobiaceae bacterium]
MSYDDQNIFAKILRGEIPNVTVYEDDDVLAFMDVMPHADGHCLVIPKEAAVGIYDASAEALSATILVTQKLANACKTAFNADGVTIRQHNDPAGGQEVFHLHFHVVPRHDGVGLRPQTGKMEDIDVLVANAEKIKAAL